VIDVADYTVWCDSKENTDLSLFNRDANKENGADDVDEDDYLFWRANFGVTLGSGAGAAS
jgi:hypothetical protein